MNVDGSVRKQKWNREAWTSPCYTDKAHAVRQQCGWLLIQETCWSGWDSMCTCFYWWIPQFSGCSLCFFPARLRHLEMSLTCPSSFLLLFMFQFDSMKLLLFAHNPNTSASTLNALSAHADLLVWPTHLVLLCHQSVLTWKQADNCKCTPVFYVVTAL